MLKSLKSTGKGAVILPHGVLFRGNSEATIRKEIIKRGYIKGIIGLPANLFYSLFDCIYDKSSFTITYYFRYCTTPKGNDRCADYQ